jgi:hypothetical protein
MLPEGIEPTVEMIPCRDLVHDIVVNPRIPSDSWRRTHLEKYNPALLGSFVISERLNEDGSRRELAILDGANRVGLMKMVSDQDRPVLCNLFHGLTVQQEAEIAREYNDRRGWTGVRVFQAKRTEGDPTAVAISSIAEKYGWIIDTAAGEGVLRGVVPFDKLIASAGIFAARQAGVGKGTERWRAALESGRDDALRVLEQAFMVYTAAFPERPGSYAADIMHGMSLVLLKFAGKVSLERLTTQLRVESKGQLFVVSDSQGIRKTMNLSFSDGVAFYMIRCYNKGLPGNSKARLDDNWKGLNK